MSLSRMTTVESGKFRFMGFRGDAFSSNGIGDGCGRSFHGTCPKNGKRTWSNSSRLKKSGQLLKFLTQPVPVKLDFHNLAPPTLLRWIKSAPDSSPGSPDVVVLIGHTKEHIDDASFEALLRLIRAGISTRSRYIRLRRKPLATQCERRSFLVTQQPCRRNQGMVWIENIRLQSGAMRLSIFGVLLSLTCLSAQAATIYVDGGLNRNCTGNYSVPRRDGTGKDGDAYRTVVEAANVAKPGDTVLIRAGVYHDSTDVQQNDVLWPKHSGTADKPITFRPFGNERVVLGDGAQGYPDSDQVKLSIARCVVTLKDVNYIVIENIDFKKVEGWVFARHCNHLIFRNCTFEEALRGAKGTARFIECSDCRFLDCSFLNYLLTSLYVGEVREDAG